MEKFTDNVGAEREYTQSDQETFKKLKIGGIVSAKINDVLKFNLKILELNAMNEIRVDDTDASITESSVHTIRFHDLLDITDAINH